MTTRRTLLATVALALIATPPLARETEPFTKEAFAAAQAAGESILVHINAPWCPTCRAQRPILEKLQKSPKFEKLKVFRVDFDSQSDIVRSFRATSQSTLIVFKGKAETGRSVGETDPDAIAALLEKAL